MKSRAVIMVLAACALGGCAGERGLFATVGPDYAAAEPRAAGKWQASLAGTGVLPHEGKVDALTRWWDDFDDPLLSDLLRSAQAVSADLASAQARIAQSRASAIAAGARGLPMFDIEAAISRSSFTFGGPATLRTQQQIGLQASWEIDLFGGLAREREAARAQLMARTASWHDARVSVAAETADAYLSVRDCERRQQVADADQASRRASLDATERLVDAGFQPPSERALARASVAEAASQAAAVRADCSRVIKRLVELSAMDEDTLRGRLASSAARLPQPPALHLDSIPARALRQRPDISAAERELAEASARVGVAEAARYPALSLSGNITPTRVAIDGGRALSTQTWSIGPTLTLPLFDAGRRAADAEAARAEYAARASAFDAAVRRAVREVEEALVRLDAVAQRLPEATRALAGYGERLTAVESQRAAGLASLNDEEIARRAELSARSQLIELERERVAALIALYRASGGDWTGPQDIPQASHAGDSR